ncbi:WXG100 family type VII secretion target [Streptomyces mayteni]
MSEEVKLAPEEVDRVMGIINQAYSDMEAVSTRIGAFSGSIGDAYQGAGTTTAMSTYDDLNRAGQALATALDGLSQDLGLTANAGRETDAEAQAALSRVQVTSVGDPGTGVDMAVARGI